MKKVIVRSLDDPELEDGADKLRILAYPYFPEVQEVEYYSSMYRWFQSHPLANEVHRWVAVADGGVVGHLAAFPLYYRINGQRIIAYTPGDYMVHPQYGFYALALMRRFFRTCENCVSCDMVPAVIGVETRLGCQEAGKVSYTAKLLNVSRLPMLTVPAPVRKLLNLRERAVYVRGFSRQQPATGQGSSDLQELGELPTRSRLPIPAPVKALLNQGLRGIDGALGAAFGGDLRAQEVRGFDASFDELFERIAAVVPCVPEKDAAFLRWRYGPGSFQAPVTVLGVRGVEGLLGYAVLKVSSKGQDGNILDLMTLPGRGEVARALLREAIVRFRRMGVQIIRYRFVASPTAPSFGDLRRLGFFRRDNRRYTLLVKFADHDLHKMARDTANWSYSIGDGEASFWVR